MEIILTKILVAFLFAVIRFFFGIIPIKINACLKLTEEGENATEKNLLKYGIGVIQAFGGGVLFATCFLHMMPQVYESVEELKEFGVLGDDYPYSQLVISLGFFTIYFAEEISQWVVSSRTSRTSRIQKPRGNKVIPRGMAFVIRTPQFIEAEEEKTEKNEKDFETNENVDEEVQTEEIKNRENLENLDNQESNLDMGRDVNAEIEEIIEEGEDREQMLRCFLMVLALSLHAIFEGLAIGLQRSVTNIWYLFVAVSIHSATILFVIGFKVVMAGASTKTIVIHMVMLSATSPFGVLLGLIITLTTNLHTSAKSFAIVLLEGLSAGTILYITFFETLSREKQRRNCRMIRAACIGVGFTLMAILQCFKFSS